MTPEEEKKNQQATGYGYSSGFSAAKTRGVRPMVTTGSSSTTQTSTTTREKPDEFTFTPPQQTPFSYDPGGGLIQFFPKKPDYDQDRERRLKQVERVASLGEVFKSLGQLAGGGYAPVRENGENKTKLRAFAELDRMRREYSDKLADWENRKFVTQAQDYQGQKNAHIAAEDKKEVREFGIAKTNYDAGERFKDTTAIRKGQSHTSTREDAEKFLTENAYNAFRAGGGSGKKDDKFVYRDTDGTITVNKDQLIQFCGELERKSKRLTAADKKELDLKEDELRDDLEVMKNALAGGTYTDNDFKRKFGKYVSKFRTDKDMKYLLAGSFSPYENKPDFVPERSTPFEEETSKAPETPLTLDPSKPKIELDPWY